MSAVSNEIRRYDYLTSVVARHMKSGALQQTPIPGVRLTCGRAPTAAEFYFAPAAVYFVVQGRKQVVCNGQTHCYGRSRYLVSSLDMPVSGRIIEASHREPCLGVHVSLHPCDLSALVLEWRKAPVRALPLQPALYVGQVSPAVLDALVRLVDLLDAPADIPVMAPLITREIFFRLLQGDHGDYLAHIAVANSRIQKIASAIKWLKDNYTAPLRIEELARHVNMSQSSLHHRFKAMTGMSPLRYQKALRLQEARQRLISDRTDVTGAALSVGYDNLSQFIREYSRQFGAPPLRDVNRFRNELKKAIQP